MKSHTTTSNQHNRLSNLERDANLPAFNEALTRLGYPVRWTWDEFNAMGSALTDRVRMRRSIEKIDDSLPIVDAFLSASHLDFALTELVNLKEKLYFEKYLPRLSWRLI